MEPVPVTPAESPAEAPLFRVHESIDWIGPYGSPGSVVVIAKSPDTHVWLGFARSEFSFAPPSLQPRAARELAAALIAAADAIEGARS